MVPSHQTSISKTPNGQITPDRPATRIDQRLLHRGTTQPVERHPPMAPHGACDFRGTLRRELPEARAILQPRQHDGAAAPTVIH